MNAEKFKEYVDASNLKCPLPLLKMKLAISNLDSGEILKVISTDPSSWEDFASYAKISGNKLLKAENIGNKYTYIIQKG